MGGKKKKQTRNPRRTRSPNSPLNGASHPSLNVALQHHRSGEFEKAEAIYKEILERDPGHVDALHLLGVVSYQRGDHERAAEFITKAIARNSSVADFHLNLASVYHAQGQFERAVECCKKALEIKPHEATALNNLGNAYRALGKLKLAFESYQRALVVDPNNPIARTNLGNAYKDLGDIDAAIENYQFALRLNPNLFEAHINLGAAFHENGNFHSALDCYRRAVQARPDNAAVYYNLGNILQEQGYFDEARAQYEAALSLNPDHAKTHYNLALSRKYSSQEDDHELQIKTILARENLAGEDRIYLLFALAKIKNDSGLYDEAFKHYEEANRLARPNFNRAGHERFVSKLIEVFSEEFFQTMRIAGDDSERPVLIVGVPRSGITLVEQILASHPGVAAAGELLDVERLISDLSRMLSGVHPYPESANFLSDDISHRLACKYLDRLRSVSESATFVTDKMPTNYLHLGLLAVLFPNARIIHCRRNPVDVCLSCYFQYFSPRLNFTFDLEDLGFYYCQYERLMGHWHRVLPMKMFDIDYEELVRNQESSSRRLIDFCGLEWHEDCLAFYESNRPVKTASSWQVRQPIYPTSISRWKRHDKHLAPLKQALGRMVDESK